MRERKRIRVKWNATARQTLSEFQLRTAGSGRICSPTRHDDKWHGCREWTASGSNGGLGTSQWSTQCTLVTRHPSKLNWAKQPLRKGAAKCPTTVVAVIRIGVTSRRRRRHPVDRVDSMLLSRLMNEDICFAGLLYSPTDATKSGSTNRSTHHVSLHSLSLSLFLSTIRNFALCLTDRWIGKLLGWPVRHTSNKTETSS